MSNKPFPKSLRKLADDFLNLIHWSSQFLSNLICRIMQFLIIDLNHPFQFSLCKTFQLSLCKTFQLSLRKAFQLSLCKTFFSALILNLV